MLKVTQSMLQTFMRCRLKSKLYLARWEKDMKGKKDAAHRGTLWHKVLELHYQGKLDIEGFLGTVERHYTELDEQVRLDFARTIGHMFPVYQKFYQARDAKIKRSHFESVFEYQIEGVLLSGKLDCLLTFDKGSLYLEDTKTKGQIDDPQEYVKLLVNDFQMLTYCYVLRKMGYPVKGCVHNIIRWPSHKSEASLLADLNKRPDHFFIRVPCDYSERQIESFGIDTLIPVIREFSDDKMTPWKNTTQCAGTGGMKCEFLDMCSSGSTIGYSQTREFYKELSTEIEPWLLPYAKSYQSLTPSQLLPMNQKQTSKPTHFSSTAVKKLVKPR